MRIAYQINPTLTVEAFQSILLRSGLAARRPVEDLDCLQGMLDHADLLVTAMHDGNLVGLARSVTDFTYCCYLSDLAVDSTYQHQGIGAQLQEHTHRQLGPRCSLILLSAPAAIDYYPKLGYTRHEACYVCPPGTSPTRIHS